MPDLLKLFGLRRRTRPTPAGTVALAALDWERRAWIDAVIRQTSLAEVKAALENAGFKLDAEGRLLLLKPGRCEGCRDFHVLSQGLNSDRWLCANCGLDELCST